MSDRGGAGPASAALWERVAASHPERPAVVSGDRVLTWGDLDDRANRLASVLWEAGLRPGDRVGIHMPSRPEYIEGLFAIWKASYVAFTIDHRHGSTELAAFLDGADPAAVLVAPQFREVLDEARHRLGRTGKPGSTGRNILVIEAGPGWEAALASVPSGPPRERPIPSDKPLFLDTEDSAPLLAELSDLSAGGTFVVQ